MAGHSDSDDDDDKDLIIATNTYLDFTMSKAGGSEPGWGSSPGGGHGNLLQYSCLENPKDRGAWWEIVHGI